MAQMESIKNVALAGHGGTGKSTLFESLLFAGGAIAKTEVVGSGKTVGMNAPDELERGISIRTSLASFERDGVKVNLFDTPGASDFTGEVILAFRASEFAALTVDGRAGVQIETIKLWRNLEERKKPRAVIVTKMDEKTADF
ncbi:MAG: GTP-binding protein, partial [Spirochaetaceae bacterium]|nr:GTP-binding protein [Spirochaetaceae bacterium]